MRILITGCNGQLGHELQRLLARGTAEIGPIPEAYADADITAVDVADLDITDAAAVDALFAREAFDIVFNGAAYTNVAENLARACAATGAKLVHVSTDYVFSGAEPGERTELDEPDPISAYGRTKLAGERAVRAACDRSFVVRTAWLYGYVGKNFVKTMLRLADSLGALTVVDDQLGNPTSANDLAYELLQIALTDDYGIYHCTNNGICSWAAFARAIVERAGYDPDIVSLCTSEEYAAAHPDAARRPAYSALANAHLAQTIGDEMRPWDVALDSFMANLGKLGA